MFGHFLAPTGVETHLDRQGLTRSAFCTKNQLLASTLRPIRGRFPFLLDLGSVVFEGRVAVLGRLNQTLCFCRAGSADRTRIVCSRFALPADYEPAQANATGAWRLWLHRSTM